MEDGLNLLYEAPDYDVTLDITVELVGKPASDIGGVKRHFFTLFLLHMPVALNLVEENAQTLFFTCNTDSLLKGHYCHLARSIIHSIIHEGPAFPCLSKSVYYYLVGGIDL